ncbi:MAG: hypothetical protein R3D34_05050 [Nitratireductor sp.]
MLLQGAQRVELVTAGLFQRAGISAFPARRVSCGPYAATCISLTGKAEERLSFDIQRDMAARLKP